LTPLSRESDEDVTTEDLEDLEDNKSAATSKESMKVINTVLSAIEKVRNRMLLTEPNLLCPQLRKIVKAVRSSPQRRQNWVREIQFVQNNDKSDERNAMPLMLILDVRTRWSSTHQMLRKFSYKYDDKTASQLKYILGRALDYRTTIDSYVSRNKDLHSCELSDDDWQSIALVMSWLKSFRSATTQMSSTKTPMISTTLAIFRGLQEDLKHVLCDLPKDAPPQLKLGLFNAYRKLSDYYYKYDESPFYTWAACMY
jgi:hypothetical protein